MNPIGMAVNLLKRLETASAAQQSALAANAADTSRLQKLTDEIAALEQKVDAEDLSALHDLAARRDQRERLGKTYSAAAEKRLRDADAASAITDTEISDLFREIQADLKEQIVLSVRLFVSDEGKAIRFAETCDSILQLHRHANIWGSLPAAQRYTGLLIVLRQFLAGNPPWIFTTTAANSTETESA